MSIRITMRNSLGITLFLLAAGCATPTGTPTRDRNADVTAIRTVLTEFQAAMRAGDATRIGQFYTQDGVVMPNHGTRIVGRAAIEAYEAKLFSQFSAELTLKEDQTEGADDWAYQRGEYTFRLTAKAPGIPPIADQGNYVAIFRQEHGAWRLTSEIANSTVPLAPSAAPDSAR
jgi:uncharacterized protein (TIGR02246 family)